MEDEVVRLQKYLAQCGVASRREAEEIIRAGRVMVNGVVIDQMGAKVSPEDHVLVDGNPVSLVSKKLYIALNKPLGVVSTAKDPQGRPTVVEMVAEAGFRVVPIGRLDVDTQGLLLLTNDGELQFRLTHPRYEVEKIYVAGVRGFFAPEAAQKLRDGVELLDGMTAPARILSVTHRGHNSFVTLGIHEGRNRQVRRMLLKLGYDVLSLKREAIGPINLSGLTTGAWRHLTDHEVAALHRLCDLPL